MSLFRQFEEDPFFSMNNMHREHMRHMHQMMQDPLHSIFNHHSNPILSLPHQSIHQPAAALQPHSRPPVSSAMQPFGGGMFGPGFGGMFPDLNQMMGNMQRQMQSLQAHGNNMQSYSSSSYMSYSNTGDGQPRIYQASSSTRQGPYGVKETRKSVRDSHTGVEKMAIGHHIKDRAHIVQRSRNRRTGEEDENQDFVNIEEEEADQFNHEWKQKAQSHGGPHRRDRHHRPHAITDGRRPHHTEPRQ